MATRSYIHYHVLFMFLFAFSEKYAFPWHMSRLRYKLNSVNRQGRFFRMSDNSLNVALTQRLPREKEQTVLDIFRKAQQHIKSGDNLEANKLLQKCIEINPYDSHRHLSHEVIITSYVLMTNVEGGRWGHRPSYHYGCYDRITNQLSHEVMISSYVLTTNVEEG